MIKTFLSINLMSSVFKISGPGLERKDYIWWMNIIWLTVDSFQPMKFYSKRRMKQELGVYYKSLVHQKSHTSGRIQSQEVWVNPNIKSSWPIFWMAKVFRCMGITLLDLESHAIKDTDTAFLAKQDIAKAPRASLQRKRQRGLSSWAN